MKQEKTKKQYANIKVSPLPDSQVEIEGELFAEYLEEHRVRALKHLVEHAEIPGFRKGNAPEHLVLQHYSDEKVLQNAAYDAIDAQYWDILTDQSIKALGEPSVTITKLAQGNPLGFKIKTAIFPDFKLPEYKKIAAEKVSANNEPVTVEEKDVDEVLKQLQHAKLHQNETKDESHKHAHTDKEHSHDESEFSPIDDAFAQAMGPFKTVDELKAKIRENVQTEKEFRAKEKRRVAIIEGIVEKTDIAVPDLLIENELQKMLAQFKDDVARAGLTYETYLEHMKKTEADIKTEWRDTAIKRAKTQLILARIAKDEDIKLDEAEVTKELDHIMSHHKDADRFRARMFVENMMQNEKVLVFLEGQK